MLADVAAVAEYQSHHGGDHNKPLEDRGGSYALHTAQQRIYADDRAKQQQTDPIGAAGHDLEHPGAAHHLTGGIAHQENDHGQRQNDYQRLAAVIAIL